MKGRKDEGKGTAPAPTGKQRSSDGVMHAITFLVGRLQGPRLASELRSSTATGSFWWSDS